MASKTVVMADMSKATKEQLEENLRNIQKEIPMYEKHKKHNESLLALHTKRLELMEAMSAISDVKNQNIQPTYEFQKDPEWVRLHSELLKLNSANERDQVKQEIERIQESIKNASAEGERFAEAIPIIEAELAKRAIFEEETAKRGE